MGNTASHGSRFRHHPGRSHNHKDLDLSNRTCLRLPQVTPGVGTFTSNDSSLVLFGQYLEDKQLRRLKRQTLQRNATNIQRISFLSCSLGMDCPEEKLVRHLTRLITKHAPNLQWLLLTGPMLFEHNEQVAELLNKVPTHSLERLCLGFGGSMGARVLMGLALARLLSRASKLQHLNLHKVNWRDPGALQALAEGIHASSSLSYLDLSQCRITDRGFQQFVSTLCQRENKSNEPSSSPLETLLLRSNYLTSVSLKRVARLISSLQGLKHLDVSSVDLFEGAREDHLLVFFQSIEQSTSLLELHLSSAGLDKMLMERLLHAVSKNPHLRALYVNDNPLSRSTRIQILTKFMPKLNNLTGLFMGPTVAETEALEQQQQQEQLQQHHQGTDGGSIPQVPLFPSSTRNAVHEEENNAFLRALRDNAQLTRLTVVHDDSVKKLHHPQDAASEDNKLVEHIQDVLRRNALNKRFQSMKSKSANKEGDLALWPQYIAQEATPGRGSSSLVYQVLHHHMHFLSTTP